MTATPKIYGEGAQKKAEERGGIELASMSDESKFGPLFFHRGFAWAIQNDLLVDYKVVVLTVPEAEVSKSIQNALANVENELTLDVTTKIVGCYKALMKESEDPNDFQIDPDPCRRALAFCSTIARSKVIHKTFNDVIMEYRASEDQVASDSERLICVTEHVDGSTPGKTRTERLSWLSDAHERNDECRVLTNVRCLSEGVDVPALDAILFFDARQSQIDVVQALGRVMRKSPGKKLGYVILPIAVPAGVTPEAALNDNERYRVIWATLNALRSHDERIEGMIAAMQLGEEPGDRLKIIYGGLGSAATVDDFRDSPTSGDGKLVVPPPPSPPIDPPTGDRELGLELANAIYAKVVEKCGVLNTWTDWAKDIADIARHHITRLTTIVEDSKRRKVFEQFLAELRDDLNDSISESDAIEMLAQHLVTKPVFDALFQGDQFTASNSVSQAMDQVIDALGVEHLEKERATLDEFYRSVQTRATEVKSSQGKQELIRTLYEKFFQSAFTKLSQRLGIVYTPVEAVDFILHSVNDVLREHFEVGIGSTNVHVLDPFVGTGTFLSRLLDEETGFVSDEDLQFKYTNSIHGNEIVPLAYYIAGINIESTYHDRSSKADPSFSYQPFDGLCLADTFQSTETGGGVLNKVLPRNHYRLARQLDLPIEVIVANPPYSVGQRSADDNARNIRYEKSDLRLQSTYVTKSPGVKQLKSIYDSYIRAFRWASDRIDNKGVIGFITNAGWLTSVAGSGIRACFREEFSKIYVFNLRGDQRGTIGVQSRKEGGKFFGGGSRAPIAITLLIKDPTQEPPAEIRYYDIGDYLSTEQKREKLVALRSIKNIAWQSLQTDDFNDWLNHRDFRYADFIPLFEKGTGKSQAIFESTSPGCISSRDAWAYNYSYTKLSQNVKTTFKYFNTELLRYQTEDPDLEIEDWVLRRPQKIAWGEDFYKDVYRGKKKRFTKKAITPALYRPFSKRLLYYDRSIVRRVGRQSEIFSTNDSKNRVICIPNKGTKKPFSCIMANSIADFSLVAPAQCFPLYYRSHNAKSNRDGLGIDSIPQTALPNGLRCAISSASVLYFESHYPDAKLDKESIFYYVYGILHSPAYRADYQTSLFKELARIPVVSSYEDYLKFSDIGRKLGDLHVDYESADIPKDVKVNDKVITDKLLEKFESDELRVSKMRFLYKAKGSAENRTQDKSAILFNNAITVSHIPEAAYEYVVNGRPAIEWIMDQYQVKTDTKTEIKNDPNDYAIEMADDPAYILKLLLRIITVSIRTKELVAELPRLDIKNDFTPYDKFRDSLEGN